MKNLNSNVKLFGDGTFHVPPPFYQLYTIHIDVDSCNEMTNIVPLLYALLPDKSQNTYERLFTLIKDQFGSDIPYYKCDFEVAQMNAFKTFLKIALVRMLLSYEQSCMA